MAISRSIFITSLYLVLATFSALTHADVIRCVDRAGAVTYTNLPCNAAFRAVTETDEGASYLDATQRAVQHEAHGSAPRLMRTEFNFPKSIENSTRLVHVKPHSVKETLDFETIQAAKYSFMESDYRHAQLSQHY